MPHREGKIRKTVRVINKKTGKVITFKITRKKKVRLPRFKNLAITGTKKVMRMLASIKRKSVI